ncbi:SPOR domain-containing protein [Candidatus Symbiobacter mobilis]|uniref:DedD protein n=1 Tax=Candidatus Symbiobacter mobilis CR TaxID=946483 RepID=U5NBB1_9BURK|nr:SPOR domain-containing protein [Candidatus Symbiobacter mobilis]AGX88610.1 DedD protein [Candidatus Symbiobacter mobilis CR]
MRFFPSFHISETPTTIVPAVESVERLRRRARNRLLGAGILIAIGVVGLPLVFDKQPRPINVDVEIEIPDRDDAPPLVLPPAEAFPPVDMEEEIVLPAASAVQPAQQPKRVVPMLSSSSRPVRGAAEQPVVARLESARAQALLDGAATPGPMVPQRFVVQVGKDMTVESANELRKKLLRAGLSARIRPVGGKKSKLVRVQVGPFVTRQESQAAQRKVQALGLTAVVSSW